MVGDTQTDDPWLGIVLQIDDGLLQQFIGLSCWEIWWMKWSHWSFNRVSDFMGIMTQRWMGPCFRSHSGRNADILVCGDRVAQDYHHLGGVVCLFCVDVSLLGHQPRGMQCFTNHPRCHTQGHPCCLSSWSRCALFNPIHDDLLQLVWGTWRWRWVVEF